MTAVACFCGGFNFAEGDFPFPKRCSRSAVLIRFFNFNRKKKRLPESKRFKI